MPKTNILNFTSKSVFTEVHAGTLVSVAVKEPNLSDILDGIYEEDIKNWARNYKKPDYFLEPEVVVKWVKEEYKPEEVFTNDELEEWARANGYAKEAV